MAVLDGAVRSDRLGADPPFGGESISTLLWRELEAAQSYEVSLFTGHTGVLWAMAYSDPNAAPAVADAAASIAAGLTSAGPGGAKMHFDLVLGATGLLVLGRLVAQRSGRTELFDAATAWLDSMTGHHSAWSTPTGRYRTTPPAVAGSTYYDWGVAHGIPGVTATLVHSKLDVEEQSDAAAHLDQFVSAAELVGLGDGLRVRRDPLLPIFSGPRGLEFGGADSWCYGDAGACAALAIAVIAAGAPRHLHATEALLDAAASSLRRGAAKLGCMEPGLCHGAAGLVLLAARLHHATGQHRFAELATHITERALELGCFDAERVVQTYGYGLLRGVTGVALALHAVLSAAPPSWDMMLALS